MKVESESEVAQLCLTFSDPMDCSLPGSSIHGIFRATVLEWGAIVFGYGKICALSDPPSPLGSCSPRNVLWVFIFGGLLIKEAKNPV